MTPLRMCTVCRERKEKKDLIRIVCHKEQGVSIDTEGTLPGRGAYLCKNEACIRQAQKRRVLERAFSRQIDAALYDALERETEDES